MINKDLKEFFINKEKVALAFSGGVDSSYLLYAGIKSGIDIKAYFVKSAFQPEFELEDGIELAKDLGANLEIIRLDLFSEDQITDNPDNRCYYCKKKIFSTIIDRASSDGYTVLIDGTNASDDYNYRPGMKALDELGVISPLRDLGITKDEVRKLSKEGNLKTYKKPAYSCLATRVLNNEKITQDTLDNIERAEGLFFSLGLSNFRIRVEDKKALIQVEEKDIDTIIIKRKEILEKLKNDFSKVILDLEVR